MRSNKTAVLWLALAVVSSGQSSLGQFSLSPSPTPASSPESAARLPVTRVILYKNGVGYFEHAGHVRGSQDVNVDFTTAQLNDVLKSLTVLDLGKGRITGVSYNSAAPLEKRLGSLRLPVGENPTTAQFLDALRGARLEVRNGSESATGRLLSIEERDLPGKGDQKITLTQISVVSDGGEVRIFDLTPSTSVRVAEKEVNEEVGKYLGLVAIRNRDASPREVVIEHPARPGWKLADDEKPAETSASFHRFRLTVEPKKTTTLLVKEYRPILNSYQLTNVSDNQIKFFLEQKMINPEVEKALRRIVAQKNDIAVIEAVITGRRSHVSSISDDQQRVRENMKALKGSAEEKALVERYVRELNEQEDRVQSLRREIADMQQKRDAVQSTLNGMIEALQMEVTL
jgi:hypothetical protein